MTTPLAVVIPAFKARFFADALRSLARQTDRDFVVYVGDDDSPEDLRTICDGFAADLRIEYHRFPTRLGRTSLAGHWNRCVALSRERWVWLFSDDDLAESRCVAAFREGIAADERRCDVYRFPVGMVDGSDNVMFELTRFGEVQSPIEFILRRLQFRQMSFAVDKVFAREAFEREGGFVDFPCAWCSDDASWMAFARLTGMRQISGGGVYWRWSDLNLSATFAPIQREKIQAAVLFLEWLDAYMDSVGASDAERKLVRQYGEPWVYRQLATLQPQLRVREVLAYSGRVARACRASRLRALWHFARSASTRR
jgi:hypothetical protein